MTDPVTRALPKILRKDPGPFGKKDTDLGKLSQGNFDVAYQPRSAELQITFRAKYDFEHGIPANHIMEFKRSMLAAIDIWDNSGVYLKTRSIEALNKIIQIRFQLVETDPYNKIIDVDNDDDRAMVAFDLNISINDRNNVSLMAHELGHVFGNYDEYDGGFLENLMWWHDNDHLDDKNAMMNSGYMEFRKRYFDHFQEYVNENFEDLGIHYDLEQGPAAPIRLRNVPGRHWIKSGVNFGFLPYESGPCELRGPIRSRNRELIQLYRHT